MAIPRLSNPTLQGPQRLSDDLRADGAARLGGVPPRERAGDKRTLQAYAELGMPLELMWGTLDSPGPSRRRVRHACLIVPSSGRTAMAFLTAPDPGKGMGSIEEQVAEIAACLGAACAWCREARRGEIHLIQALPARDDAHAIDACEAAGFQRLGDLIYLSGDLRDREVSARFGARASVAPAGIEIRTVAPGDEGFEVDREHLKEALERSYEQTLDCPELCGLRDTADVLESHRLAGIFDPALWFLAFEDGKAVGCGLFSVARGVRSVELVYLGVGPSVRGRGLASHLLWQGITACAERSIGEITCAVDARNMPAIRLYGRAGLHEVGRRVALVMGTRDTSRAPGHTSP